VISWTGFYIGANVGGGWGSRDVDYTGNDPASAVLTTNGVVIPQSFNTSGALGGLQLGYNWQFNRNWLIGFETDFDWSNMKGSTANTFTLPNGGPLVTEAVDERIKWFGTVRARLGYLPTDNLLAYVAGGFAYGRVDHSGSWVNNSPIGIVGSLGGFSLSCGGPGQTCFAGSSSHTATGWTVGGGLEYAFWQRWTVKAEYLYVSLESTSVTESALTFAAGTLPTSYNANFRTNFNVARGGVNYRF
jgi:outer membrane immunogenic protein